tara:strand:- start:111 stop:3023 length:2913 start_codon:yes stop_codon:yes gene_type:complete
LGEYATIFQERKKKKLDPISNPIETIFEAGRAILGSDPVKETAKDVGGYAKMWAGRIPDPIKSGGKIVGSAAWDAISWLDKFRGAAAGAWDVTGEYGPKLTRDESTGEYKILDQEGSVMDPDFMDALRDGINKGWINPSSADFSDEFRSLVPQKVWESKVLGFPIGKVLEFGADVTPNVGGDPLTHMPSRWLSIPFKIVGSALKYAGINKLAHIGPVKSVLEAFNVHVGDAAHAQKLVNDMRLEERGEDILSAKERLVHEDELMEIAMKAGVSVPELKSAITEAAEMGDMGVLGSKYGAKSVEFAGNEVKFYEDLIAYEKSRGINIKDIRERGVSETGYVEDLGVKGYIPHIAGREMLGDTLSKRIYRILSPKFPSQSKRNLEGSIKKINEDKGRAFFLDDPLVLHAMRKRWSNQATAAGRLFDKAQEFGVKINKKKPGFDIHGNPIPSGWKTIRGTAFPSDFARILERTEDVLTNKNKLNWFGRHFDTIQNWWKKYALALRPAWHTRNAFGNVWNSYIIGGLTDARRYGEAAAIQKAMQTSKGSVVGQSDLIAGKITGKTVKKDFEVRGTGMTREEIYNEAVRRGVYEAGLFGSDVGETALRQSNIIGHTQWKGVNKAFAAGKVVENNARLALFIDSIAKGIKQAAKEGRRDARKLPIAMKGRGKIDSEAILDAASLNVRKSLFDYSDLSQFEKTVLKRAMPFYTWTRKNIPAQLRAVLEHPDRAQKANILINGLQRDTGTINEEDIDRWVKDQFPIFLNAKDSEDTYTFVTAMSYLPTAELNRVFQDTEGLKDMAMQMGTPLLKVPLEIFINYDHFKERPIDLLQNDRKRFGEGFWNLHKIGRQGSADFLGIKMTPKQKHLFQSLVLLGEVDRLNPWNVFGDNKEGTKSWAGATRHGRDILESSRWIRAIMGARVYKRKMGEGIRKSTYGLVSDLEYLRKKLEDPKVIRNEDLRLHVLRQINEIMENQ